MPIFVDATGMSMGNRCRLPDLTPRVPEMAAPRAKSRRITPNALLSGERRMGNLHALSTRESSPPQDVHRWITISGCGDCRFGCRVERRGSFYYCGAFSLLLTIVCLVL